MKKFRKQDSEKYFEEKKPVRLVDTQEYMEMIREIGRASCRERV
mgnify:CR=1 FL=1